MLDDAGDLHIAVADMRATDELTVADLAVVPTLLGGADALVVDANLDATVIRWLLSAAQEAGVRSVFEPVSVAKATAAAPVFDGSVRVHTVTPNVDELPPWSAPRSTTPSRACGPRPTCCTRAGSSTSGCGAAPAAACSRSRR